MKKLSNNFNDTFLPERNSLSNLLNFIQNNEKSSLAEIKRETGISNGTTTGKIKPFINYLYGMGLIFYEFTNGLYNFKLTEFGKIVFKEDPNLSMHITQWVCHANLCDLKSGSDVWISMFNDWKTNETRDIVSISKISKISLKKYTPLLGMYINNGSFEYPKVIEDIKGRKVFKRNSAPLILENIPGFGAVLIHLLANYCDKISQVSIPEFESKTGFSNRFGWDSEERSTLYEKLANMGYIKISSLVVPRCIQSLISEKEAWLQMYSEIM
ncbi:MAG: hypothetical protein WC162_00150 [Sphaerochaetaceae bacterium]